MRFHRLALPSYVLLVSCHGFSPSQTSVGSTAFSAGLGAARKGDPQKILAGRQQSSASFELAASAKKVGDHAIDLSSYSTPQELCVAVDVDSLRAELARVGLMSENDSPLELAKLLFLTKFLPLDDIPKQYCAAAGVSGGGDGEGDGDDNGTNEEALKVNKKLTQSTNGSVEADQSVGTTSNEKDEQVTAEKEKQSRNVVTKDAEATKVENPADEQSQSKKKDEKRTVDTVDKPRQPEKKDIAGPNPIERQPANTTAAGAFGRKDKEVTEKDSVEDQRVAGKGGVTGSNPFGISSPPTVGNNPFAKSGGNTNPSAGKNTNPFAAAGSTSSNGPPAAIGSNPFATAGSKKEAKPSVGTGSNPFATAVTRTTTNTTGGNASSFTGTPPASKPSNPFSNPVTKKSVTASLSTPSAASRTGAPFNNPFAANSNTGMNSNTPAAGTSNPFSNPFATTSDTGTNSTASSSSPVKSTDPFNRSVSVVAPAPSSSASLKSGNPFDTAATPAVQRKGEDKIGEMARDKIQKQRPFDSSHTEEDDKIKASVPEKPSANGVDLDLFDTSHDLCNAVDAETVKAELARIGLSRGGTAMDRAKRLFLTKHMKLENIPKQYWAENERAVDSRKDDALGNKEETVKDMSEPKRIAPEDFTKPEPKTTMVEVANSIDLNQYDTSYELCDAVDTDTLTSELKRLGLKTDGTPLDRAKRLFITKHMPLDSIPTQYRAGSEKEQSINDKKSSADMEEVAKEETDPKPIDSGRIAAEQKAQQERLAEEQRKEVERIKAERIAAEQEKLRLEQELIDAQQLEQEIEEIEAELKSLEEGIQIEDEQMIETSTSDASASTGMLDVSVQDVLDKASAAVEGADEVLNEGIGSISAPPTYRFEADRIRAEQESKRRQLEQERLEAARVESEQEVSARLDDSTSKNNNSFARIASVAAGTVGLGLLAASGPGAINSVKIAIDSVSPTHVPSVSNTINAPRMAPSTPAEDEAMKVDPRTEAVDQDASPLDPQENYSVVVDPKGEDESKDISPPLMEAKKDEPQIPKATAPSLPDSTIAESVVDNVDISGSAVQAAVSSTAALATAGAIARKINDGDESEGVDKNQLVLLGDESAAGDATTNKTSFNGGVSATVNGSSVPVNGFFPSSQVRNTTTISLGSDSDITETERGGGTPFFARKSDTDGTSPVMRNDTAKAVKQHWLADERLDAVRDHAGRMGAVDAEIVDNNVTTWRDTTSENSNNPRPLYQKPAQSPSKSQSESQPIAKDGTTKKEGLELDDGKIAADLKAAKYKYEAERIKAEQQAKLAKLRQDRAEKEQAKNERIAKAKNAEVQFLELERLEAAEKAEKKRKEAEKRIADAAIEIEQQKPKGGRPQQQPKVNGGYTSRRMPDPPIPSGSSADSAWYKDPRKKSDEAPNPMARQSGPRPVVPINPGAAMRGELGTVTGSDRRSPGAVPFVRESAASGDAWFNEQLKQAEREQAAGPTPVGGRRRLADGTEIDAGVPLGTNAYGVSGRRSNVARRSDGDVVLSFGEYARSAFVGAIVGPWVVFPLLGYHYLIFSDHTYTTFAQWEWELIAAAVQSSCFAVIYRYALRQDVTDGKIQRKVVLLSTLLKSVIRVQVPYVCAAGDLAGGLFCAENGPLYLMNDSMMGEIAMNSFEGLVMFGVTALAMNWLLKEDMLDRVKKNR